MRKNSGMLMQRLAQREYRKRHKRTMPFLAKPKSQTPPPRVFRRIAVSDADRAFLATLGSGSVSDGLELLCCAFRNGIRHTLDGRRKKQEQV